jgi:hypothetical protein
MAEQSAVEQFTVEYEAAQADAAEQPPLAEPEPDELPWEADPADAAEQAVAVPVDEDEYR